MKNLIKGLTAWKAVQSAATVTGYAVPGQGDGENVLLYRQYAVAIDVLWRSAFQARRPHNAPPGTAYPVTVAALRSAFQAPLQ